MFLVNWEEVMMMDTKSELSRVLAQRIAVMDGAMGTMIQAHHLDEVAFRGTRFSRVSRPQRGNNDLLSLTQPHIIKAIHGAYLEAGADIIETNTFNANAVSMADYGMEAQVHAINAAAARIAREAADSVTRSNPEHPRFVAGAMGPTNKTASMSPDVSDPGYRAVEYDDLFEAYLTQARGLIAGGVHILLVETVFDTLNAKAAVAAARQAMAEKAVALPLMVSGTITDQSGRTLSGQTPEAFWVSLDHADLFSIGLNCALGAREMLAHLETLAHRVPMFVSAYPNAGLPNAFGGYDQSPADMAREIGEFMEKGLVNVVGGCCGTTPEHVAALCERARGMAPRVPPAADFTTRLSGLETLEIERSRNFVNVGERTNVTGSRQFAKLIRDGEHEKALAVARQQVEAGAQMLDVNLDDALLDTKAEMVRFLHLLMADPDVAKVPVMLDSSRFEVLEAGLKCLQGKPLVNSISLKDGETEFRRRATIIHNLGAAAVVMAFDEQGQAVDFHRRIQICQRAYRLWVDELGFPPQDLVFDPNVLTVATGIPEHNAYALDFLHSVKWIKKNLPHARVSGGISNLSFSFRGMRVVREAMHAAFLFHAIDAGLDMGIVNAGALPSYDDIPDELLTCVEDVILNRRPDSTERLIALAETVKAQKKATPAQASWRALDLEGRLQHAVIHGIVDDLEADLAEALAIFHRPLDIIEGPLMRGMDVVGDRFGAGKMFLPQVVKSARAMKKAVAFLLPHMQSDAGEKPRTAGKVLLATVKGDVHDIGKNIVGVVLACNNVDVVDLGVMVPCERILEQARAINADMIGLSGLITPSLDEMVHVATAMNKDGLQIPLLIGGATTSPMHTAVKIAPTYDRVIHVKDASKAVSVVAGLLSPKGSAGFWKDQETQNDTLRRRFNRKLQNPVERSLEEAREMRLNLTFDPDQLTAPRVPGITVLDAIALEDIRPYVDWTFFFHAWDLRGKFPAILDHPEKGEQARTLFKDANHELDRILSENTLSARAVLGLFPCQSRGDDLYVYEDESLERIRAVFPQLRQQGGRKACLCLADFVAPVESGLTDYLGLFAVSAGFGAREAAKRAERDGDDYRAIMIKALADRLAEALAEWTHEQVRRHYWGYALHEHLCQDDLISEAYQGIRPALGYPACPDHSEKRTLFKLLGVRERIGMELTETCAMDPAASVSGFYFSHPKSRYFAVGRIDRDQVLDYAERKGVAVNEVETWLAPYLAYRQGDSP